LHVPFCPAISGSNPAQWGNLNHTPLCSRDILFIIESTKANKQKKEAGMKIAPAAKELPPEKLHSKIDTSLLAFGSTQECKSCEGIIGQERALKAIQTGLDIKSRGYNIFISGMLGTGRTTTIKKFLDNIQKTKTPPDDILYVNNFKSPDEPSLIMLPAGKGKSFKQAMTQLIEVLKNNIPELLKSQYYTEKRDSIIESQQKKQKEALKKFEAEVAEQGFSVIQVQIGTFVKPDVIPVIEGKATPFDALEAQVRENKFSKKALGQLHSKYETLTDKLEQVFKQMKEREDKTREMLKEWDKHSITPVIKEAIDNIRSKFKFSKISTYLDQVEENLNTHVDVFKVPKQEQNPKEPNPDPFFPFYVNLIIDNSELKKTPVVMETNPSYVNLFGSIESTMNRFGFMQTDFTKIKAGSFLKANGGYLVINALEALLEPGVWPTLKRTLRNQTMEIQNFASLFLFSTSRLKPEPIKIDVKVIMIGDSHLHNLLFNKDEDFKKIFKIKAEFDSETPMTKKTLLEYADFVKKITEEDDLLPLDKHGMAALLEYSMRLAGRHKKLSTRFHHLADVVRESNYWAKKTNSKSVIRHHVEEAIQERFTRDSLIEDKIQEMIDEGTIMIDTKGAVVGQVNGLAVYMLGQYAFGKPSRITAITSVGRAGVINIEREADLSGRTHNKGVLILGGYLRGKYAQDKPLSMSASIAFEQAYSGVDGDSASSTEVYAILSSLSKLPLRQDIAVTGSLNQKGEIQPIGGVNEKIEGFFDVCKSKRLTGSQGVIIPHQNARNLMLRADVIEAVKNGQFHVYPIKSIDEGIQILTGIKAGNKRKDGTFEKDTVHYLVDQELQRLAKSWKTFDQKNDKDKK
jgi:lon-related putative ATP-dependent protease